MPVDIPKIPDGLEELMRGLSKAVLKDKPTNIIEFAAEYFESLLIQRDGSLSKNYEIFESFKKCRRYTKHGGRQNKKSILHISSSVHYEMVPSKQTIFGDKIDNQINDDKNLLMNKKLSKNLIVTTKNDLKSITEENVNTSAQKSADYAARVIQRVFRRYILRKRRINRSNNKIKSNMTSEEAAFIIQKYFKNFIILKKKHNYKDSPSHKSLETPLSQVEDSRSLLEYLREEEEANKHTDDTKIIKQVSNTNPSKENDTECDSLENTIIQTDNNETQDQDLDFINAAIKIQKIYRGFKVRRDFAKYHAGIAI